MKRMTERNAKYKILVLKSRTLIPVNSLRDYSRIRVYSSVILEKIRLSQAFLRFTISLRGAEEVLPPEGRLHRVTVISTRNRKIILSP